MSASSNKWGKMSLEDEAAARAEIKEAEEASAQYAQRYKADVDPIESMTPEEAKAEIMRRAAKYDINRDTNVDVHNALLALAPDVYNALADVGQKHGVNPDRMTIPLSVAQVMLCTNEGEQFDPDNREVLHNQIEMAIQVVNGFSAAIREGRFDEGKGGATPH